ncbi:hypothetical protein ACMV5I_02120 [Serratia sp. T13T92]|uniref:hypothetical protein n=1 Tax=Serratia sp. T13T92 TaxID=3397496 RepID=UPI0039E11FCD
MTLEQRVEALEKKLNILNGKNFSICEGEVFIQNAVIESGSINAAHLQAAKIKSHITE